MLFKLITLGPLTVIFGVVLFRALFVYKPQPLPEACIDSPTGHQRIKLTQDVLNRFMGALNIATVSYKAHNYERTRMTEMIDYIERSFPAIHKSEFVRREIVSNYSLLYTIEGSNRRLSPYMLTSHMDVVPANRHFWSSDPFNATLKEDNYIYGRGTIDAKHLMVAMLEALEFMLTRGFRPQRSFYLVFGHDEEVGGLEGAQEISKLLERRLRESQWPKLEYILDEGTIISRTRFPGLDADIGLVGVVEKGAMTVRLSVNGSVGHGSMPPPQTAIGRLSAAVAKFHNKLFPSFMGLGPEKEMIEIFAAHAKWPYKLVYANFWLFRPLLDYIFSSDPTMNSFIRTSTAVTMIRGGSKENVLPDSAEAFVNHRIHQLQSSRDVLEFDQKLVEQDDPGVRVEIHGYHSEPSPVSPYCAQCYGFQLIKQSLLQVYPRTIVVPNVFLAASDSRWYCNLSDSIYKLSAIAVHLEEMKRFHGHDERISVDNYENLINFYHHLIENSDSERLKFNSKQERDEL